MASSAWKNALQDAGAARRRKYDGAATSISHRQLQRQRPLETYRGLRSVDPVTRAITDDVATLQLPHRLLAYGSYKRVMVIRCRRARGSSSSSTFSATEVVRSDRREVNGSPTDDHRRPLRSELGRGRDPTRSPHAVLACPGVAGLWRTSPVHSLWGVPRASRSHLRHAR